MPELEISNGGNGDGDDEEDKNRNEDGEDGGGERRLEEKRRREDSGKGSVFSISMDFRNAINRSFSGKKRKKKRRKERADGEIKRYSSLMAAGWTGRRSEGCYVCFMQTGTEKSLDTPTSDPNSKSFSFGKLRKLIQRNDFYSKECNPHI